MVVVVVIIVIKSKILIVALNFWAKLPKPKPTAALRFNLRLATHKEEILPCVDIKLNVRVRERKKECVWESERESNKKTDDCCAENASRERERERESKTSALKLDERERENREINVRECVRECVCECVRVRDRVSSSFSKSSWMQSR